MKQARRYAEGTDVPVSKTRGDIEALLTRHRCAQILSGIDRESRSGFVGFTLQGRQYRVPLLARRINNRKPDQVERESTVGAELAPRLAQVYETGQVRALLPEAS